MILARMRAGDLSEFLVSFGLIPVKMDIKKLLGMFSVSEAAKNELSMILPAAPQAFGLTELDEAYNLCYSSRSALKKELAIARAKSVYEKPIPKYSIRAIDAKMAELTLKEQQKKQQEKLITAYEAAVKRHQAELLELAQKIKASNVKQPDEKKLSG